MYKTGSPDEPYLIWHNPRSADAPWLMVGFGQSDEWFVLALDGQVVAAQSHDEDPNRLQARLGWQIVVHRAAQCQKRVQKRLGMIRVDEAV